MTKWECYIEEYMSSNGLSARLREKDTNKKIEILIKSSEEKMHFLRFLSAAKTNKEDMPTVFDRDGEDIIAVYGIKKREDSETILVDISKGGYQFE